MSNLYVARAVWLAAIVCVATAAPARADCDRPRSAVYAMKQADVVFRGIVRRVETDMRPSTVSGTLVVWPKWVVSLDVSRVWKGQVGKQFVLRIVQTHEDDAFEWFERGSEYLVFAVRNSPQKSAVLPVQEPTYGATACGGTASMLWAIPYLVTLGPGRPTQ